MKVLQIYMRNSLRNFNYIVYSEVNNKAIFVDPLDIAKTMPIALAKGLEPSWLINTHRHHDHVKNNEKFLQNTNAVHLQLDDGEKFYLSKREWIEAVHTPGHTQDHFCYLLYTDGKTHSILAGDTLFNAGVGNCKNGGNPEALFDTITKKIAALPDHLLVYPGHDYLLNNLRFARTIEPDNQAAAQLLEERMKQDQDSEFILTDMYKEKEINPFLRLEKLKPKFKDKDEKEIFLELRALRDQW